MRNIKLIIQYDGSRYKGWQRLGDTDMTIQGKIESVLSKINNENIELTGSGRTDVGVHGLGQVANFKTNSDMSIEDIKLYLYKYLPEDIVVSYVEEVDDRFHSRYTCTSKTYLYKIWNSKYHNPFLRKYTNHIEKDLDIDLMKKACVYLIGEHDFTSFASSKSKKKSNVREIYSIDIEKQNELVEIYVHGNGFLYNMVRIISGALIDVGLKKIKPEDIKEMLEAKDRTKASDTALAKGLYLYKVNHK
jgi:tRNA pseudouridine38-40 synthase